MYCSTKLHVRGVACVAFVLYNDTHTHTHTRCVAAFCCWRLERSNTVLKLKHTLLMLCPHARLHMLYIYMRHNNIRVVYMAFCMPPCLWIYFGRAIYVFYAHFTHTREGRTGENTLNAASGVERRHALRLRLCDRPVFLFGTWQPASVHAVCAHEHVYACVCERALRLTSCSRLCNERVRAHSRTHAHTLAYSSPLIAGPRTHTRPTTTTTTTTTCN